MRGLKIGVGVLCLVGALNAWAAEREVLQITKTDSMQTVLMGQQAKTVTLRLASGQEITGKLSSVGDHVVYLTQVRGIEYFDSVIDLNRIEALVVRVQQ